MSTAVDNAIKAAKAALKAGDPVAASRAGIYQGSTGKWRGFEPYLKPLMDHFGAG